VAGIVSLMELVKYRVSDRTIRCRILDRRELRSRFGMTDRPNSPGFVVNTKELLRRAEDFAKNCHDFFHYSRDQHECMAVGKMMALLEKTEMPNELTTRETREELLGSPYLSFGAFLRKDLHNDPASLRTVEMAEDSIKHGDPCNCAKLIDVLAGSYDPEAFGILQGLKSRDLSWISDFFVKEVSAEGVVYQIIDGEHFFGLWRGFDRGDLMATLDLINYGLPSGQKFSVPTNEQSDIAIEAFRDTFSSWGFFIEDEGRLLPRFVEYHPLYFCFKPVFIRVRPQ